MKSANNAEVPTLVCQIVRQALIAHPDDDTAAFDAILRHIEELPQPQRDEAEVILCEVCKDFVLSLEEEKRAS